MKFNFDINPYDEDENPTGVFSIKYNEICTIEKILSPTVNIEKGKIDFANSGKYTNFSELKDFVSNIYNNKHCSYTFHEHNGSDFMRWNGDNDLAFSTSLHSTGTTISLILNEEERMDLYRTLVKITDWCEQLQYPY